jgi:methylmalonyl-CoA mutase N-terminal domain/subunit
LDNKAEKARWEAQTEKACRDKGAERKPAFRTQSGIEVKRLYGPDALEGSDYMRDSSFPGEFPFTRGVQPTMYRGRLWTMRQYSGFGTARETNKRYRYLLEHGQTGLSVAFDLPTQMGYDPDDPMSRGEVGRVGVAVSSVDDAADLFDSIPLDKVSTSMTINATASVLLAMYVVCAEESGVRPELLNGTIQNDILKEYVARGTYIFPPAQSMRIVTDIFAFCREKTPKWNTISISGYHMREAGCNAVQEAAFTLADGIAYVEAALKAGLKIDDFASRLSFFFNVHNNFFEEVAKFRAARRIWARIVRERFGAKDPRSMMLRFHTQTAGSSLTAQQPQNNVARVTLQALAAVLGGTQSLHTCSMDEALALPTEDAVRTSLRTQQIIAHESGVADTIDPVGGSYFVESLTSEIEEGVRKYLAQIESMGGMVKAIETGFIQREIQNSAYAYQKAIESKELLVAGVNEFRVEEEPLRDILKLDPKVEKIQVKRVRDLRKKRSAHAASDALKRIEDAAAGTANLMPAILDAVRARTTIGEIAGSLKKVFGEYQEKVVI